MEKFLEQMAEILEEDTVSPADVLMDFEAWDSLTRLSIIAFASETCGVTISAAELKNAETIEALYKLIEGKK
ncbi:MAG: phosphopantetheine-binding protein [Fibromonadales bacterium]|nr:phosphopantetheine-binding protein [Fibromonadales bacterium]